MLRKLHKFLPLVIFIALTFGCSLPSQPPALKSEAPRSQNDSPLITPSTILTDLQNKRREQPQISNSDLAQFANSLLEKKGFNYDFDLCEVIGARDYGNRVTSPSKTTHQIQMSQNDSEEINFRIVLAESEAGMCGECFVEVPALQVTDKEIVLLAEGRRYQVKRPDGFSLDKAELVDETMKTVLRTWQMPYQAEPLGVSEDGASLYLALYTEDEFDGLVLELSESGVLRFRARSEIKMERQGESIENHPEDPLNDYLSFVRFHVGEKSYIVKFSSPCT